MTCTKCQNGMVKALAAEGEPHKWKWVRCPHCNRLETTAFISSAGDGEGALPGGNGSGDGGGEGCGGDGGGGEGASRTSVLLLMLSKSAAVSGAPPSPRLL